MADRLGPFDAKERKTQSRSRRTFIPGTLVAVAPVMPTNPRHPDSLATVADDSAELARWIDVLRDAYRRNAHLDLVVFGESDGTTTSCWSSCPASTQKREFLQWLADTTDDAEVFFVADEDALVSTQSCSSSGLSSGRFSPADTTSPPHAREVVAYRARFPDGPVGSRATSEDTRGTNRA